MSYVILQDVIEQTVQNTTTETTVFSGTVSGGLLGQRGALFLKQSGRWRVENQAGRTYTIRLKFGGVTVFTLTSPGSAKTTLYHASWQRWVIANIDDPAVQRCIMYAGFGGPGSDTGGFGTISGPIGDATNAATIDTASNQTLELTVQLSTASPNHIYVSHAIHVIVATPEVPRALFIPGVGMWAAPGYGYGGRARARYLTGVV